MDVFVLEDIGFQVGTLTGILGVFTDKEQAIQKAVEAYQEHIWKDDVEEGEGFVTLREHTSGEIWGVSEFECVEIDFIIKKCKIPNIEVFPMENQVAIQ